MMKTLLVVALVMSSPAGAEEVIHYEHNPMLDIQAFVDVEIKLANQDVLDTIARESATVVACPQSATEEGGLFRNIEDTSGETSNPPISTRLGKKEYAIEKIKLEEGKFCYHLVSPVERTLTLEEGRLLATALALRANPTIQNYYEDQDEDTAALNAKIDELFVAVESKRNIDRLAADYGIRSLADLERSSTLKWATCKGLSAESEAVKLAPMKMGFIYNTVYSWKWIPSTTGGCYWLKKPVPRGLDEKESRLFDAAVTYGVTPSEEQMKNDFFYQEQNSEKPSKEPGSKIKSGDPDSVTSLGPLANFNYPYSAIALITQNGANAGTAFQVAPNGPSPIE